MTSGTFHPQCMRQPRAPLGRPVLIILPNTGHLCCLPSLDPVSVSISFLGSEGYIAGLLSSVLVDDLIGEHGSPINLKRWVAKGAAGGTGAEMGRATKSADLRFHSGSWGSVEFGGGEGGGLLRCGKTPSGTGRQAGHNMAAQFAYTSQQCQARKQGSWGVGRRVL